MYVDKSDRNAFTYINIVGELGASCELLRVGDGPL
jgi:hypothetical protein